ncbi:MAG: zinc-ribbon domain containing protein [Verrucomicrobiales bacterium]
MTRRRSKSSQRDAERFRDLRICKLIDRGWIEGADEIPAEALPVDPDLLNLGGSYHRPIFFADQPFTCQDCGTHCVWRAEDQRWYFETFYAPYYAAAKRCRACRRSERQRKTQARIRSGHATGDEEVDGNRSAPLPSCTRTRNRKGDRRP